MRADLAPPSEVQKIRDEIKRFFDQVGASGHKIGSSTCAVYAFFDYDGEPIYIGQTVEELRTRVRRHLTGHRSDAVGKFVLDPFEVLEIEVWPQFGVATNDDRRDIANRMEHAVFQKCLAESEFGAVLNEGDIAAAEPIELPPSHRGRIVPDDLYDDRKHPDVRIARRAATIASLARLISERQVSKGLRHTLLVQAQRLESLSRRRWLEQFADPALPYDQLSFDDEPVDEPVEEPDDGSDDESDG
jgi:hypothetical protein